MNISIKNKVLKSLAVLLSGVILSSCATNMQDMQVVRKQLEEGKLIPAEVVERQDFLNQYDHKLPATKHKLLQIDIAMEKQSLMASGDSLYVQVGLVSKKPKLKARDYHILVSNMFTTPAAQISLMKNVVKQFDSHMNILPTGSKLSVDWMKPGEKSDSSLSGLLATELLSAEPTDNLESFIRRYARSPSIESKDHFILLLGDHGKLSYDEKQNLIDLANIFRIRGSSLSVLSVADKAEVAFLNKMTGKSDGLLNLHTKDYDYVEWMQAETRYINASKIKDIRLSINSTNGAKISQVLSPANIYPTENKIKHNIKQLVQGENYVILAKLDTPVVKKFFNREIINVNIEYYDADNNRYEKDKRSTNVNFVYDRNKTIAKENRFVKRSKLILGTQNIINDIVPVIRDKRYYQAAGLLTEHSIQLEKFADKFNDQELHRDAKIIHSYANRLFDYNEKSFEAINIWYDLSWDTDRFSERYQ